MLAGITEKIQFTDRKWQDKQMLLTVLDHEQGQLLEATGYCLKHEIYYTGRHTQTKLGYPKGWGEGRKSCLADLICLLCKARPLKKDSILRKPATGTA